MPDVLEQGRADRPPPRWQQLRAPRWLTALLVVAVLAAVGGYVVRGGARSASAPASTPAPSPADVAEASWATAEGACGTEALLPRLVAPPLAGERTGLRVLVGGSGLRLVDVDSGVVRPVPGLGGAAARPVEGLARSGSSYVALTRSCTPFRPAASVLEVDGALRGVREIGGGRVDGLVSGERGVWGVEYPEDPTEPVRLRPLLGAPQVRLPARFVPRDATRDGFVGNVAPGGGRVPGPAVDPDGPLRLGFVPLDPSRQPRDLGSRGASLAADARSVLTTGRCVGGPRCVITRTSLGAAPERQYPLPAGRVPLLPATLSPDGQLLAMTLVRPGSGPDGPQAAVQSSTLAVLDLRTGQLSVLPGLEIPPGTSVGLTWAAQGRRLVVALPEGDRTRLLVWWPVLARSRLSPASLPGRLLGEVPVIDVSGDRAIAGR